MTAQNNPLGEYSEQGFSLKEQADDILELYFRDTLIASYNQTKVTPEIIREGCQNYLNAIAKWKD